MLAVRKEEQCDPQSWIQRYASNTPNLNAMVTYIWLVYINHMFNLCGGHVRERDMVGMRRTSLSSSDELIVVSLVNIFHLYGMVLRDAGASDRHSGNANLPSG